MLPVFQGWPWQQAGLWRFMSLALLQPRLEEAVFQRFLQGRLLGWNWRRLMWRGLAAANVLEAEIFGAGHLMNHSEL